METNPRELDLAVDRFLSSGAANGLEAATLARAVDERLRAEAQKSLKKTLPLARRFVRHAQEQPGVLQLTAYRALARFTHMSARHAEAEQAYLFARNLAGKDAMTKGRIDRALIDVYMYLGNFVESRRRARLALAAFKRLRADADIAMTQVNLANLLHRQDKHRDAERMYYQASMYFESVNDELSTARCYYNRANTLVQLFEFAPAHKLYELAQKIYSERGLELDANDARYGLAWLAMLQGRFHIALVDLHECEQVYRRIGQPKGAALCELDRAEVYLGLDLLSDARDAARESGRQFRAMGHRYETSKAAFFQAKAAFGLGLSSEARRMALKAKAGFEAEKNVGFLGALHLLLAQLAETRATRSHELGRARAKFARAQLPLWSALCDLHDAGDLRAGGRAMERLTRNRAVHEVPQLYAWWQAVLGDKRQHEGKLAAARTHWQRAADRLDAVRAQLPPLELRSGFSKSSFNPHLKLIDSQLADDPKAAAAWSERYKTAGLWAPMLELSGDESRRRAEISLVELANQVALLSRRIGGLSGERGTLTGEAHRGIARLQNRVRVEMAAAEKHASSTIGSLQEIQREFERTSHVLPIIQFHGTATDVIAFIHQGGNTRMVRLVNGRQTISSAMRQWRFLLESELLAQHLTPRHQAKIESKFFQQLGEAVWKPLEISATTDRILILPEGDLANLPWQAVEVGGQPLLSRHSFVLAPSLRHFLHARRIHVNSPRVELFQGVADDLPMVQHEVLVLGGKTGANGVHHAPATRTCWPSTGEARLWHYAGHAQLRTDNPFYSSLALADGPLFAADFRLRVVKVGLVTLAACRSGQQVSVPGEESTGLVRSLLEMGARNVIAGYWPVSDNSTALWMNCFYDKYFAGCSLGDSARHAAGVVRQRFPSAYHWAAFAVYGSGD